MIRNPLSLFSAAALLTAATAAPAFACDACGCSTDKSGHGHDGESVAHTHGHADDHNHHHPHKHGDAASEFERDRRAILDMAGEYEVTFQFQETVPIQPGYEAKDPYRSTATEFVEVIEDTGEFISLQHVLVLHGDDADDQPRVVKHWRQDWTYQDTEVLRFRGDRTWENVELSPGEVEGTWSQAVYQVDDSPRYEGVGAWTHVGERSAWESGETWRPLPRREHTKRSDYDVLVSRNRHTLTPDGWVHEQDSYKLVLEGVGQPAEVLVHESGLNVYDRTDDVDFTAGREYWDHTRRYWQDVRAIWADILDEPGRVAVQAKLDDQRLYARLFDLAEQVAEAERYDAESMRLAIREEIAPYVDRP